MSAGAVGGCAPLRVVVVLWGVSVCIERGVLHLASGGEVRAGRVPSVSSPSERSECWGRWHAVGVSVGGVSDARAGVSASVRLCGVVVRWVVSVCIDGEWCSWVWLGGSGGRFRCLLPSRAKRVLGEVARRRRAVGELGARSQLWRGNEQL